MCYWKYMEIVSFLIVTISCSPLSFQQTSANATDLRFKGLKECLTSAGVEGESLIYRDSGNKYEKLNHQWNSINGYLEPMAYLLANNVSDVQNAVICCQLLKIRIVARSGGQSYLKNSFGDSNSLVVDLARLNKISFDPIQMNCEIGPGAQNGHINVKLTENNIITPTGIGLPVGMGGSSLGGGWGYFTRMYGLVSDNIIEMEMVDAKGRLLLINNSTNDDLFYALRGGGGGSFGIVTKFKSKIYPAPSSIVFGCFEYDFVKDFLQFYQAWQSLIQNVPKHVGTIVDIKDNVINFQIFYINSTSSTQSDAVVFNILDSFSFPEATNSSINIQSHPEFLLLAANKHYNLNLTHISHLADITTEMINGWKKVKSFYVSKPLDTNEINTLYRLLNAYVEKLRIVFLQNGGMMDMFPRTETAFVHRNHLYDIQMSAFSAEEDLNADRALKAFYEKSIEIFNHRESYQNYLDQDIPDHLERYYGENLERLIQIKMKIDPENVFHHPQSIPNKFTSVK